jgi:hypothetical protein
MYSIEIGLRASDSPGVWLVADFVFSNSIHIFLLLLFDSTVALPIAFVSVFNMYIITCSKICL